MIPKRTAIEVQELFCYNVCNGFLAFCKDNKINITTILNNPGKTSRQTVYAVSRGKIKYIPIICLCYLAALLGFSSPSLLEQYYINQSK
ncbi:MAG: hypothetical protein WCL14_03800 [Bacteroidota bacterium]